MARILIVEDNAGCQALAYNLLSKAGGHDVVVASTADEAVTAFATHQPVLVIMDMALKSATNGVDLTKQFKAAATPPKILAVSAFQTSYYADDVIKAGADAFLPKPYGVKELLEKVTALLATP